jgi:hypothetical protein
MKGFLGWGDTWNCPAQLWLKSEASQGLWFSNICYKFSLPPKAHNSSSPDLVRRTKHFTMVTLTLRSQRCCPSSKPSFSTLAASAYTFLLRPLGTSLATFFQFYAEAINLRVFIHLSHPMHCQTSSYFIIACATVYPVQCFAQGRDSINMLISFHLYPFIYLIIFTFTHMCIHCLGYLPHTHP